MSAMFFTSPENPVEKKKAFLYNGGKTSQIISSSGFYCYKAEHSVHVFIKTSIVTF